MKMGDVWTQALKQSFTCISDRNYSWIKSGEGKLPIIEYCPTLSYAQLSTQSDGI